jgi:hypothetical protein
VEERYNLRTTGSCSGECGMDAMHHGAVVQNLGFVWSDHRLIMLDTPFVPVYRSCAYPYVIILINTIQIYNTKIIPLKST